MGKAGRMACIFVPMALTVVSLVLLTLVGLGQTNADSHYLSDLYYLRANTTGAAKHPELLDNKPNNQTVAGDESDGHIVLFNSYSVGLWNYCAGGGVVSNSSQGNVTDPAAHVAFCTARQTQFAFNPEAVWGLPETFTTRFFSSELNSVLNTYEHGLAKAIGPLYILTTAAAGISVLVGFGAIFSRIGSIITTLVALVTAGFAFAFAIVTTVAYFTLEAAFNKALDGEDISFQHGAQAFAFTWLAVAALLVGSLFWAFSSCCVSGHSSRKDRVAQPANYGNYQRMDHSPAAQYGAHQQSVPLTAYGGAQGGGAYEPYRHA